MLPAGRVDLAVTLSATPNPVTLDAPTTWTITVTNRSPRHDAAGRVATALFRGDGPFRFDAPTTPGCTVDAVRQSNHAELAPLGPLAGGATATITLTGRSSFAGDVFGTRTREPAPVARSTRCRATTADGVAQHRAARQQQRRRSASHSSARAPWQRPISTATASTTSPSRRRPRKVSSYSRTLPTRRTRPAHVRDASPQALGGEALGNDVAVADLDRDGDLDIVVAARRGAPDRAFLSASGSFTSTALGDAALDSRAVAVGDVNGDAFVDLVFANPAASTLLVNTGSGGTLLPRASDRAADARDVLLVDLFGDTLPELVLANADGDAAVYRQHWRRVHARSARSRRARRAPCSPATSMPTAEPISCSGATPRRRPQCRPRSSG